MMKGLCFKWLFMTAICILPFGCQQIMEDDWSPEKGGLLNVKTRSAGKETVSFPVYLYAFDEEGNCANSQIIEDSIEVVKLELMEGSYRVVALSGISDDYAVPDNPTSTSCILLENTGGAETALMVGKADVKVGVDAETSLEITMTYVVSAIQVSLANIPSDISAVTVSLSPFYSSMSMEGVYGGENQALEMQCELNEEEVWVAETRYVFPGSSSETVFTITMEKETGGADVYSYTWQGSPQANSPYNISGTYSQGIAVEGNFSVSGWGETTDVEFEFGAVSKSEEESKEESDADLSGLPEVGSIWNGAIVVDVGEADSDGVEVLLMTLDEWTATVSQVDGLIAEYNVDGVTDWRIPDYEEAKLLRDNLSGDERVSLNECIADYDGGLPIVDGEERYLCEKSDDYYSFIFSDGTAITKAGSKRTYYVRLVKYSKFKQ